MREFYFSSQPESEDSQWMVDGEVCKGPRTRPRPLHTHKYTDPPMHSSCKLPSPDTDTSSLFSPALFFPQEAI